jgi:hypothetical protein
MAMSTQAAEAEALLVILPEQQVQAVQVVAHRALVWVLLLLLMAPLIPVVVEVEQLIITAPIPT